ncbi:uncharacterized protein zgc:66455 [Cheilinus undulatus]|uniref:uncharacterized protein zgc:66455 n=1 Tax=Cheilinus undulatus TaxID=241271 RepID=UPI001BD42AE7|nr:uncharacterized protein zgc:66455 [Cheilinus undulatus]
MPQKKNFESMWLIFLLIFWKHCSTQVRGEEANGPPDDLGAEEGGAFFALRSCHQLLHSDSGEFFSPDYLCSNPPLWCNWTIRVDPGKRIHLHLEDLTPDDTCHLKQDQVHVDEPAGPFRVHKVLLKCWREVKFTSSSNTLYVMLLIRGHPSPPYRGFYGRYQAFGPPVVFHPQDGYMLRQTGSVIQNGEDGESDQHDYTQMVNPDLMYDYYDQHADVTPVLPWDEDEDMEVGENQHAAFMNFSHIHSFRTEPTVPTFTQETSRSGRGADRTPPHPPDLSESPQQDHASQDNEVQPTTLTPTVLWRDVEVTSEVSEGATVSEENRPGVSEALDQMLSAGVGPEKEPEPTHPQPNMVEQLSDHRGHYEIKNHSGNPHLPGDYLFEVAVEVNFQQDFESSEQLSMALQQPVKALITKKLEALHSLLSLSFKRVKRISVGALCILWLQVRHRPEDLQVRRVMNSLHELTTDMISLRGRTEKGIIMSMSIADVNECGTMMVMCDVNADCVNKFGSYVCHCRPGLKDASRLGSGGTVCVDVKETGCSSGLSAETKGVYVLFFLLSSLILMLLGAAGMLYHRHHRGAFLVRCHSNLSHTDPNNNHHHQHHEGDPDLTPPPPPPPARGFREGWPQMKEHLPPVDLPLLRFSPLLPPDDYTEPQEGGRK